MGIGTIIVIILLGILVGYIIFIFNKIVKASNANFESFSNVDVALKKRFDLLPNLENIVKGFANHESVTLEKVTEMREALSQKMTVSDRQKQEDKYSALMKDVLACVENYPELKAGESFINLQNVLVKIEDDIEKTRRDYNTTTREFNNYIQKVPNNILASILGYKRRPFFEVDLLTREEVKIDFPDRRSQNRS